MRVPLAVVVLAGALAGAGCRTTAEVPANQPARFVAADGSFIELDLGRKTFLGPGGERRNLQDCGDAAQSCFSDGRGFGFSDYRRCNDWAQSWPQGLKFSPKIVSVVHNHSWVLFEEHPAYLFHFVEHRGIVGLYVAQPGEQDFRRLLQDGSPGVLSDPGLVEYRLAGTGTVAACD